MLNIMALMAQDKKNEPIILKGADKLQGGIFGGRKIDKLIGNVRFTHKGAKMRCDSAYQYKDQNAIEAFGNVKIEQGDTLTLTGDKLTYDGKEQLAKVRDNVVLKDKETVLRSDHLDYNRKTNRAYYFNGGNIDDGENYLESESGYYNTKTKFFTFKNDVMLKGEDFTIESDTLNYDANTEIAYFVGPTTITNEEGVLQANDGIYETQKKESTFYSRAQIDLGDYFLEGDTLFYNQFTDRGEAYGDIKLISKKDDLTIYGQKGIYEGKNGFSIITGKPLMQSIEDLDTFYLSADTLISIDREEDTTQVLFAFHEVKMFREDFQSSCDSMKYNRADSTITLYNDPVMWNGENQISADTIQLFIKKETLDKVELKKSSFIVSKDSLENFNQIKGRDMSAFFADGAISRVLVNGNSESIYYALEGDTALIGMNRSLSSDMSITFEDNKLLSISLVELPEAKFYPPDKIEEPDTQLKGFAWRIEERPVKEIMLERKFNALTNNKEVSFIK